MGSPAVISSLQMTQFRGFKDVHFTNVRPQQLIIGANGAGKTTSLWAAIFLLHAHNRRHTASARSTGFQMSVIDLSLLLNQPVLSAAPTNFLIRTSPLDEPSVAVVSGKVCGDEIHCAIKANGNVIFKQVVGPQDQKDTFVRFAFVGASSNITVPSLELASVILSSMKHSERSSPRWHSYLHWPT